MDPASATSLAAAILQLAEFTGKVLSRSQELYHTGSGALFRHAEVTTIADSFQALLKNLELASGHGIASHAPTQLDILVSQARDVTEELQDLLNRLATVPGSMQRWKSIRQAVLTIWKESQLRDLEHRVDAYRKQIDSALLHELQ